MHVSKAKKLQFSKTATYSQACFKKPQTSKTQKYLKPSANLQNYLQLNLHNYKLKHQAKPPKSQTWVTKCKYAKLPQTLKPVEIAWSAKLKLSKPKNLFKQQNLQACFKGQKLQLKPQTATRFKLA